MHLHFRWRCPIRFFVYQKHSNKISQSLRSLACYTFLPILSLSLTTSIVAVAADSMTPKFRGRLPRILHSYALQCAYTFLCYDYTCCFITKIKCMCVSLNRNPASDHDSKTTTLIVRPMIANVTASVLQVSATRLLA